MNIKKTLLIVAAASAVAGGFAIQSTLRANDAEVSIPITDTAIVPAVDNTAITPTGTLDYQACSFRWSYQNLPELTETFESLVHAQNPGATARAQAFGEDCVYADGTSTFLAMETDYYVELPVADLANQEALGNWIMQVMPLVDQLPPEKIAGLEPGFVEFWFVKSETERTILRISIDQYKVVSPGKGPIEIFRFFNLSQSLPT